MQKVLFQTQDGGKTFKLVSDLTSTISGYPTGISVSFPEQGNSVRELITITSHEQSEYLFQSVDGGKNWESVTVKPYEEYVQFYHINAYPPVFFGDDRMSDVLLLQYISENPCYAVYQTTDGFFVDYTGTLFTLSCDSSH